MTEPRFIVVEADSRGYMDKDVACSFYRFVDKDEAEQFTERVMNHRWDRAKFIGGYPGAVYTIGIHSSEHFSDPAERIEDIDEWHEAYGSADE